MNLFSIVPFTNPSGAKVFRVSGMLDGKQVRKNFKREDLALNFKQDREREAANLPVLNLVSTDKLTADQLAEAEFVFRLLKGRDFSLTFAVNFAVKNYHPTAKSATMQKAFDLFMEDKRNQNLRPVALLSLKNRVQFMVKQFPAKLVNEIHTDDCKGIIYREGSGALNRLNYFRGLTCFFNWCVKQEYVAASPMAKLEPPQVKAGEPKALALAQVRALMVAAQSYNEGELVPWFALAIFCGLRPEEIARLSWDKVDLKGGQVILDGSITKMGSRRVVKISDNALAFLRPHALKRTPFKRLTFRVHWAAVRDLAGVTHWVQDYCRHTAISFYLAKHKDAAATAEWAGNSVDVIQKHYKALIVNPDDVPAFWDIRPGDGKMLTLAERMVRDETGKPVRMLKARAA